jgi:hypothetical protein
MPEKYVKWMNFWENLTPLDTPWSIFRNFSFFEFKFEFWIWAGLVPAQTGTVPDRFDLRSNRTGSYRFCKPWLRPDPRNAREVIHWLAVVHSDLREVAPLSSSSPQVSTCRSSAAAVAIAVDRRQEAPDPIHLTRGNSPIGLPSAP